MRGKGDRFIRTLGTGGYLMLAAYTWPVLTTLVHIAKAFRPSF